MALLAMLAWIPCGREPLRGQSPGVGVDASHKQKQQTKFTTTQTQNDQRGTRESPIVVDVLRHPKSQQEAAEGEAEKHRKAFVDGWTLGIAATVAFFTGLLVIVGWRGVRAAVRTLSAIERQADLMSRQTGILEESVIAATKSSEAAKASADAAKENIAVFISKERARIKVEVERLELGALPEGEVTFSVPR